MSFNLSQANVVKIYIHIFLIKYQSKAAQTIQLIQIEHFKRFLCLYKPNLS